MGKRSTLFKAPLSQLNMQNRKPSEFVDPEYIPITVTQRMQTELPARYLLETIK